MSQFDWNFGLGLSSGPETRLAFAWVLLCKSLAIGATSAQVSLLCGVSGLGAYQYRVEGFLKYLSCQ